MEASSVVARGTTTARINRLIVIFQLKLFFCVFLLLIPISDQNLRTQRDIADDQPKIVSVDGNLIFQTGVNHNITFQPGNTGSVLLDGEDLRQLIAIAKDNRARIQQLQSGISVGLSERVQQLETSGLNLQTRFGDLTSRVAGLENSLNGTDSRRTTRRVSTLEDQVRQITQLLNLNECQSSPCRNGGECTDLYNAYSCRCTPAWTGPNCDQDVNECSSLSGTDLGCQNGATCQNTPGSFSCTCTANRYGIRCTEAHDDCTSASNDALCGHGTCQNLPRDVPGQVKYKCYCDVGWKTNGVYPQCNVDVDECNEARPPCSTNPLVRCINTPGSFTCDHCPTGYTGNGYVCNDINECDNNNGGCSLAPRVLCTNIPGSRICGSCPSGYQGDGLRCIFVGVCGVSNGGCHPSATCRETPGIVGRSCTCPIGYYGDGIGNNGCVASGSGGAGVCSNNPCIHGSCQPSGNSYVCNCSPGWTGYNCNQQLNGCISNPCRNGGTCTGQSDGSYMCTCSSSYTGVNCQQPQQACGGRLTGESGELRFPAASTETYAHGLSCAWIISTAVNKMLMLTFSMFKLEPSPGCGYDFLQIHDGPNAGAHQIGRYCGMALPNGGNINTTGSQVYLWFRSDASQSSDGFQIRWSSALPTCGGNLRGPDYGTIQSPGFPGNYPNNRDCVWTVSVAPGKTILLNFGNVAMETHSNCSYDYLEVRDGLVETDALLQRYCSSSAPPPLSTTGPYAYLRFHSDQSQSDRGFQITYTAIPDLTCGGTYNTDNGVLISPNYPNAYPHNAQCFWTVSVQQGEVITFTMTNLDLEVHPNCGWDYVEVREGSDENGAFVGRFCGNSTPPVYVSSSNSLWIKFRSDPSNRGTGFRATWNVACGGLFTTSTGELRSPYFPNPYPNDKECVYVIRQAEGTTITLAFVTFDIEASRNGNCTYDYLEVRNGQSPDGPLIGRYCGSSVPQPIQSPSNALWLKFKSDGSTQNHGFRATYTTANTGVVLLPGSGCGGSLTGLTGVFQSPSHPNVYPHGVNCTWFITVTPGFIIRLTFMTFALEAHYRCAYDYVEIFDNYTFTSSIGKFCGSDRPPVLTSSDNVMTIAFVTDSSVAMEGFSASYVSLNSSTVCGGEIRSQAGVITSPNYPGNYPHSRQCTWTIVVPTGRQILLNVTDFMMESHVNCQWDYLEIRNGGSETSPFVGKYCGTSIDRVIRSHSNRMFLRMVTDSSVAHRGFRIYYDGTITGCGGDMVSVTGTFISPNYPLPYNHNAECLWQITVAQGSLVTLHFVDILIESHTTCSYDYVEVRDSGPYGLPLGRFCGNSTPDYVVSRSNRMWVKFRTDSSNHGRGFHAMYYANCNNVLRDAAGVVESPNFPRPYPANRDCTWVVEATRGNRVNASFSHFAVQPGNNVSCTTDYLELRDGQDQRGRLIGHYCGQNFLPPDVTTVSRWLYVHFVSDNRVSHNGFRLEYVIDGCGGQLSGPGGFFTSLNYPQRYPQGRDCAWLITVNPGSKVNLVIYDVDIDQQQNCSSDALEIYGGIDATSPLLTQLCHTQTTYQSIHSTGNNMFVRFNSGYSAGGRGFNASFRDVSGGCGGAYSTRTGTIMSQNYSIANYPHNTDCIWNITVEQGRPVVLTFVDFDVEGSAGCRYDYVAVYFSSDMMNSSQLMKYCGTALPTPSVIRSPSNQLFVRMRTDLSISARGFKANYKTGCGGSLSAEVDGQLTSPGWPNAYELLSNCTWVISANHTGDRITLTFLHIDIEINNVFNNCTYDYVRVLEGNDLDAPPIGTYCGTTVPAPITSVGLSLVVRFVTDASQQFRGFQAVYTKSTSACGGDFTSEHGAFNSPRYPDSYPNSVECVWTIAASQGNRIMLSFSFFRLEQSDDCTNDYLEVREGSAQGRLKGRFCGNAIPTNVTIANFLWIKFRSNENVQGQGFMAAYNSLYGGDLTGNSGQLASPLYPGNYPISIDYVWTITVDMNMIIIVTFQAMQVEISQTCAYDYVRLLDGSGGDSPQLGKFCGNVIPDSVRSSSNRIRVEFHTDSSVTGSGFLFSWQAVTNAVVPTPATLPPGVSPLPPQQSCGGQLNANSEPVSLQSPGYPYGYANNMNCVWTIWAPVGNRISMTITNLSLESHPQCRYDSVVIADGVNNRALGRFCGTILPPSPVVASSNVAFVTFRSDSGVNLTGFALTYKSVCGGLIPAGPAEFGQLTSPGYPSNYPNNLNCTWTIVVDAGRTVRLTFGQMAISGQAGQCDSADYLEVFNGESVASPSLGRFCGTQPPSVPESSGNLITLSFISNADGATGSGFNVSFQQVQLACGGSVLLTEGASEAFIASPNYPQPYPPNVDCVWVVAGPANKRLRLDFVGDFEIEPHAQCNYDFVELRDGGTANSPMLGRFCGTSIPSTQRSTGNVLYVRFRSDPSLPKKGFRARISLGFCGGSINAANSSISSPNYPANYPNNVDCEWTIQGSTGHYLTVVFTALRLEDNANCSLADYVEIRDLNTTGTVLRLTCGNFIPASVDTSDSFAYVRFHSNAQITFSGFQLNFFSSVEVCGGVLTTPFGTIRSPNYPGLYAHARRCVWTIHVPEGRRVTLTFNDLDIEEPGGRFCMSDYVAVRNGHLPFSPLIGRYCGTNRPQPIESSSNSMTVEFRSDDTVTGRGFFASYSSDSPAECGGVMNETERSGVIESPGFSDGFSYNASEQCIWVVTNRNLNSSIALRFLALDLESHGECLYDFVEIREGTDENGQLINRYCRTDSNLPSVIASPSPSLWIRFVSDIVFMRTGFQLTYKFTGCGGLLTSPYGVITSPNFPSNYSRGMDCAWKITAPEGSQISIQFGFLFFGNPSNCSSGFLDIYNGGLASSPSFGRFCSGRPVVFKSQSNQVRVVFHTDQNATPARGFRIVYAFASQGCGGSIHSQDGVITSPNWPQPYNLSQECTWDVTVLTGYHVKWVFSPPFDLEVGNPCVNDFVEIYDYPQANALRRIGRYCGNVLPTNGSTARNKIRIKFRSNRLINGNGFALNFTAGCGATFTGTQGTIVSPGYPNNYANNLNCTYDIVGDPQKYTYLTFNPDQFNIEEVDYAWLQYLHPNTTFSTEGRFRCMYDSVEVFGVTNGTRLSLGVFCGATAPQMLSSLGGMSIQFVTDDSHTDRGWTATFQVVECGGLLTAATGTITSPAHPQLYTNNANCTWIITVPTNRSIKLRFETFSLEAHSLCQYDYLSIYNGNRINSSSIVARLCGSIIPTPFVSSGNTLLLNFVSDSSDAREGFSIEYTTVYGPSSGCGGILNSTSGSIQSPDVDQDRQYENNLECVWQITVPTNMAVFIQVVRFQLVPDGCYDYLEMRDGLLEIDPLIGKYCGQMSPSNFTSTLNMLYIKFVTNGDRTETGFQLQFTAVPRLCGASLYSNASWQSLSSPNFPLPYPSNVACRWIIDAPLQQKVEISFTVVDVDNATNCDNAYVEVRDIPTTSAGQVVTVCGNSIPALFISIGRTVSVNFVSRDVATRTRQGFALNYRTDSCNRMLTDTTGRLVSPNWPFNYPINARCQTQIRSPSGYKLSFFFSTLDIEPNQNCSYDYLQIFPGLSISSPSVPKLCGSVLPSPVFLTQNTATLVFITDGSQTHRGYDITYTSSTTGCGGELKAPNGTFTSPAYPGTVNYSISCQWLISVSARQRIILTISLLPSRSTNPTEDCVNSYVTVFDGPSTLSPSVSYCSSTAGIAPRRSSTNKMVVTFGSSASPANVAFRATYRSEAS